MSSIAWLLLASAFLPLVATITAKAGGSRFDNADPRRWLASQEGFRARANAAQNNLFEGLPFYFAAVLFALHQQVDPMAIRNAMLIWVVLRLIYIGCYLANLAALRSLVWFASVATVVYLVALAGHLG